MQKGTQRVRRVLDKFAKLISELDKGAVEIEEEISDNTSIIEGLQISNTSLTRTGTTARNVANNLRKLMAD